MTQLLDLAAFSDEFLELVDPTPDEDGYPPQEFPHARLRSQHGLTFEYFAEPLHEGSSVHRYTRLCPQQNETIRALTRNQDVSERLFLSALQLFADSVRAYAHRPKRTGDLHYYPSVVLTFWAGFETYVRWASELLIATSPTVPSAVSNFLLDCELVVEPSGQVRERAKYAPVLARYSVLLFHGYALQVDRGSTFWQALVAAKELRDYYTHLDVNRPRALSSAEVLRYMEAVLLALIWPSSTLQRTLMLGQYRVYEVWEFLSRHDPQFIEQPFFLEWGLQGEYLFHCNFETVDTSRFPTMDDRFRSLSARPAAK